MKLDGVDKILLIKLDHIGDMVLATPVFKAIKMRYPQLNIDLMISPRTIGIVQNSPYIRNIYVYESSDYDRDDMRNSEVLKMNVETIQKVRKEGYEVCLNLRDDGKNVMIQNLLNIKTLISYDNDTFYPELLDIRSYNKKQLHAIDRDFELMKRIGVKKPLYVQPEIFTIEEEERWADEFLNQNGVSKTDIVIGISMGGGWRLNWWPEAKYKELCDKLLSNNKNIKIVFVGGEQERRAFDWVNNHERYISAMGMTTVGQLAALSKRFSVIVSNDGGPMHVMSTAGRPIIALFGPSPFQRYGPIGNDVKIISKRLKCSPCPQYVAKNVILCDNNKCMQRITVEEVYYAVTKKINTREKITYEE